MERQHRGREKKQSEGKGRSWQTSVEGNRGKIDRSREERWKGRDAEGRKGKEHASREEGKRGEVKEREQGTQADEKGKSGKKFRRIEGMEEGANTKQRGNRREEDDRGQNALVLGRTSEHPIEIGLEHSTTSERETG
eukprot:6194501-Pleurochrysis_carterae.AAC.1